MSDEQKPAEPTEKFCECEDRFRRRPRKNRAEWDNTDRFYAGLPDVPGGAYCPICRSEQAEAATKRHEAWVEEQKKQGNHYAS